MTVIHTNKLTKTFTVKKETVEAVKGVDIDVAPGELVAFLGPNGAGKSTTLRMLTTLLRPTSGSATVAGVDVDKDPAGVRARIGYIGQGNGGGHSYRVIDELIMQGRFYGMNTTDAKARAESLMASLDLSELAKRTVIKLSGGQRRRMDVALGLMHSPGLLFLDEPSTGMDPQNRANLWEHIMRMREEHGTTIVLTTHYMDEADSMSERVIVIDHGTIIADDTASRLKANLAGDLLAVEVAAGAASEVRGLLGRAAAEGDMEENAYDGVVRFRLRLAHGARLAPGLLKEMHDAGAPAQSLELKPPTLDDVFLELTGRSLREGAEV
ncbi:ATP-binding cassette domain-containing protein [Paenarthrobacter sp. MSM-2-10-13]|uniref:ATP-binding cassette domain-containing protein n=1 Tax=Micrococcaceae TaxID=1268 RepID=UPI00115E6C4E|nr:MULTISPECIES: ATP-binding cassette domain-containing protein [Micrococcaceae]MCM0615539.1 ATP-binding cassette domain-containing protein [Paenarthrobacter sp. TYUT067]NHW45357.1 ATP-binding cassette domain-containing protein [Paenarthrobacter sp. MSM-2-10-13]TQS92602.1 ATP-binding cassette domain-containing protein [Arthrobacter sp. TS-15]